MSDAPLPELILYTRAGCSLCTTARATIDAVLEERQASGNPVPAVVERDIETDAGWHAAYFERIPVLDIAGRRLETVFGVAKVRRILAEALDGVATSA